MARLDRGERALLRQINRIRTRHGLHRLGRSRSLQRSADYHCWDMLRANFFAHTSSNGTPSEARIARFRPSNRIGENIAYVHRQGPRRAARMVTRIWMASPVHRALILSGAFRRAGVARRRGDLGGMRVIVYTMDFASAR